MNNLTIQEFINSYLIPEYEAMYVDSDMRITFYEICDEAERLYNEDRQSCGDSLGV